MTYTQLLEGMPREGTVPHGEATLVTQDSRRVEPGAVFVCVAGRGHDGHDFAAAALKQGAGMVVSQRALGLENEVVVEDTRLTYALLCQRFFDNPAEKLALVAVTGTNGKTTVSSVLKQMLDTLGHPTGLIGTIRSEIGSMVVPARFTTPEPWDLAALMARMVAAGCTHVVMEASSQALDQGRLLGLRFRLAIFTNLSRDHLDWHGDMEQYFLAKQLLFRQSDAMLTNVDDPYGKRLMDTPGPTVKRSYSAKESRADYAAHNIQLRDGGVRFGFLGQDELYPAKFPMPGGYSVSNALAAGGAAMMLGNAPAAVVEALEQVRGVPGRCEVLYSGAYTIIRDFAHTGDGLEQLLSALAPFARGRLVVLYGCAGERDAVKRIAMSEAAARYGDMLYLTSDNPRREPEQKIFDDALPPLEASGKPYEAILDREEAIQTALANLQEGDLLALCGKGHEDYQVLNGRTVYLDERQLVEEWAAQQPALA